MHVDITGCFWRGHASQAGWFLTAAVQTYAGWSMKDFTCFFFLLSVRKVTHPRTVCSSSMEKSFLVLMDLRIVQVTAVYCSHSQQIWNSWGGMLMVFSRPWLAVSASVNVLGGLDGWCLFCIELWREFRLPLFDIFIVLLLYPLYCVNKRFTVAKKV